MRYSAPRGEGLGVGACTLDLTPNTHPRPVPQGKGEEGPFSQTGATRGGGFSLISAKSSRSAIDPVAVIP